MSDIVGRLREMARHGSEGVALARVAVMDEAAAEIERLQTENWQLRQACGYPIPADKETPQNPFKCGTCDAKRAEIERLQASNAELVAELKLLVGHNCDDLSETTIARIRAAISKAEAKP